MKTPFRLLVITCLLSTNLYSQDELYLGDVRAIDSAEYHSVEKHVFPADIRQSVYPIEIRFISFGMRSHQQATLYYDRMEGWKSNCKNQNSLEDSALENLDSLFSILVAHNLFALPDQDEVDPNMLIYHPEDNTFTGEGFGVACGSHFYIEFKVGNTYRNYHFSNPEVYAEHYPNYPFFKDYVAIKEVFELLYH